MWRRAARLQLADQRIRALGGYREPPEVWASARSSWPTSSTPLQRECLAWSVAQTIVDPRLIARILAHLGLHPDRWTSPRGPA